MLAGPSPSPAARQRAGDFYWGFNYPGITSIAGFVVRGGLAEPDPPCSDFPLSCPTTVGPLYRYVDAYGMQFMYQTGISGYVLGKDGFDGPSRSRF